MLSASGIRGGTLWKRSGTVYKYLLPWSSATSSTGSLPWSSLPWDEEFLRSSLPWDEEAEEPTNDVQAKSWRTESWKRGWRGRSRRGRGIAVRLSLDGQSCLEGAMSRSVHVQRTFVQSKRFIMSRARFMFDCWYDEKSYAVNCITQPRKNLPRVVSRTNSKKEKCCT